MIARLVFTLWLLCSGLAWANLPRQPGHPFLVNGIGAQRYGDMTFATTNLTLAAGSNSLTIVATNTYGLRVTSIQICNLPSSVPLAWDSNGNLTNDGTRSFAYSPENQLTNVTATGAWKSDFVHDGLGRRHIERDYAWSSASGNWQLTNELHVIYDGYQPIQVRDAKNNVLWTYTRGLDLSGTLAGAGGIGGLLARTDTNGSTFYHADGAGNITGLMDGQQNMAARYTYSAFGNGVLEWGPMADLNEMQFSSMPVHRLSGIPHFPLRDYQRNIHQFLTADPIGEAGGIPLHGFVGNSPLNAVDPYGLWWWDRGLFQIGLPQLAHDIFIGDRPPPAADPNSYGAMHGIDLTVTGGQRPGDFVADQAVEVAKDSAIAMAMLTPGLGEEEGAYAAADKALQAARAARVAAKCRAAELRAAEKLKDILTKNLKPGPKGDISGAISDMVGNPIPDPRGIPGKPLYDHVEDLGSMLRGLRNGTDALKDTTDPALAALRGQAQQAIQQIEQAIRGAGL